MLCNFKKSLFHIKGFIHIEELHLVELEQSFYNLNYAFCIPNTGLLKYIGLKILWFHTKICVQSYPTK